MKFSKSTFAVFLTTAATAVTSVDAFGEMLQRPHKTITMHQQLCIPGTDIVECDKDEHGNDRPDIKYDDVTGDRMITWMEYSVTMAPDKRATAVHSPLMEAAGTGPIMKPQLAVMEMTAGGPSMDVMVDSWKPDGTVTEADGSTYNRYTLRYDEVTEGNSEAEKQRLVVDSGLLPDRIEYMESMDGTGKPQMIRHYSGRNEDTMYEQTTFVMTEELTEDEMATGDVDKMVMDLAKRDIIFIRRRQLIQQRGLRGAPGGGGRGFPARIVMDQETGKVDLKIDASLDAEDGRQLQFANSHYLQIEFPFDCLDDDDAPKCLGIFQSTDFRGVASYRVDVVLRDPHDRSAEMYGEVFIDTNSGELLFVQGQARGCVSPGSVKVGGLAEMSVTNCLAGGIKWDDGVVDGRITLSSQLKASFGGREVTLELAGFLGVTADTTGPTTRFTGYEGGVSAEIDVGVLALGAAATFDASPDNKEAVDDWVTRVYLTPSLSYDFFFFSGSLSYTFRIAQVGPRNLAPTNDFRAARTPLPPVSILRGSGRADDGLAYIGSDQQTQSGRCRDQPVAGFRVYQNTDVFLGIRLSYDTGCGEDLIGVSSDPSNRPEKAPLPYDPVHLEDGEYIVRVAGFWNNYSIRQLVLDTSTGRTFDYATDLIAEVGDGERIQYDIIFGETPFEFVAADGEALYTFDALRTTAQPTNLEAFFGAAPEHPCERVTCLIREGSVSGQASLGIFEDNNHLYEFVRGEKTWEGARVDVTSQCGQSGYLTSILSEDENEFLQRLNPNRSDRWWIGLNDNDEEGDFKWVNGDEANYVNFIPGEPNNQDGNEHCVELNGNQGKWNDRDCNNLHGYIVEWQPPAVPGMSPLDYDWENCSYPPAPVGIFDDNNHRYEFVTGDKIWEEARVEAEGALRCEQSGYLTSILSADENAFLQTLNHLDKSTRWWIGLNDIGEEGDFKWVNGDEAVYENFIPGEPNNQDGNEHCVELNGNVGQWNDRHCNILHGYIVEWEPPAVPGNHPLDYDWETCSYPPALRDYCVSSSECESGRCALESNECVLTGVLPDGEWCPFDEACFSGSCDNNVCTRPLLNGDSCVENKDCLSGRCDGPTGSQTCHSLRANGESCNEDSDCTTGRCDGPSGSQTCHSTLDNGEPCIENSDCTSGRCDGNQCMATRGSGLSCNEHSDCTTGVCENGTCRAAYGEICSDDHGCFSGHCNDGLCGEVTR